MPSLAYYVGAVESRQAKLTPVTPAKIDLQYPVVGQMYLPHEVLAFQWKKTNSDVTPRVYRLEFKSADRPEVRSFLTSGDHDHLVVSAWLKERIAGRNVSWRVVSLDAQGIQTAASEWRSISVNQ